MSRKGSGQGGLTLEQMKGRIDLYDGMLGGWRKTQLLMGPGRLSDDLELDIRDLESHRNNLEELYFKKRYKASRRQT